jgi:hypothetical protein
VAFFSGAMAWIYQLCSVHKGNIKDVVRTFDDLKHALHGLRMMSQKFGPDLRLRLAEIYMIMAVEIQVRNECNDEEMPLRGCGMNERAVVN